MTLGRSCPRYGRHFLILVDTSGGKRGREQHSGMPLHESGSALRATQRQPGWLERGCPYVVGSTRRAGGGNARRRGGTLTLGHANRGFMKFRNEAAMRDRT